MNKKQLYHIHKNNNLDYLWYVGNEILVDDNFCCEYYTKLLEEEQALIKRYGENYDIDRIITNMTHMICKNIIKPDIEKDFYELFDRYLFLRREKALEEGRKIFNPNAPCRFKSIFLSDKKNLHYWEHVFRKVPSNTFLLGLNGYLFESSDIFFPEETLAFDLQVELSKNYWKPKGRNFHRKEFLFQGKVKILEKKINYYF